MNNMKDTIIKGLIALAAIIVIFASLSKLLIGNSETLAEYAQRNNIPLTAPTPVPGEPIPPVQTPPASTDDLGGNQSEEKEPDVTPAPTVTPVPTPSPAPALLPEEHFYYSSLTEAQKQYITGCSYPETTEKLAISYTDLVYLNVLHYDFEGNLAEGELICNIAVAEDLKEIFYELYLNEYPIERIELIENYEGDDTKSMEANNTSCFNYRVVDGSTSLSKHAYGVAIDINPFYNPYVVPQADGTTYISPKGSEIYADRSVDFPYKIDENDLCYKLFTEHGFTWGGSWKNSKDYQHFQKPLK